MCGRGRKWLFHDFTSIFSFINIYEYANDIISYIYLTIGLKDLSNCITDDIMTCNKNSFGQNLVYICFYIKIIFTYFLKLLSILINIHIR